MKKSLLLAFIILSILLSALAKTEVSSGAWLPEAELAATIQADGTIIPETATILQKDNVYTLQQNLNGYVVIEKNNIVFDGAGYTVKGIYGPIPSSNTSESYTFYASNITVKNTIVEVGGIIFYGWLYSTNLIIINNTINDGDVISCTGTDNLIANNTINGGFGIDCGGKRNKILWNNVIGVDRGYNPKATGIALASGTDNLIFGNNISNTEGYGINIGTTSTKNAVAGNNIICNEVGVHTLYIGSQGGAEGNIIYKNNFIKNNQNVINEVIMATPSWNGWDNGQEGNYWSSYEGKDDNKDGIGDTPYVIDENNADNYPLMAQVEISKLNMDDLTLRPITTPKPTPVITNTPTTTASAIPTEAPVTNSPTINPTLPETTFAPNQVNPNSSTIIIVAIAVVLIVGVSLVILVNNRRPKALNKQQ